MWKMVLILLLTALAMFFMGRALEAPLVETRLGVAVEQLTAPAPLAPQLAYAGVRG